jgi:hypothetical protein
MLPPPVGVEHAKEFLSLQASLALAPYFRRNDALACSTNDAFGIIGPVGRQLNQLAPSKSDGLG